MDRKKKIIYRYEVIETDGMYPCRAEYTSSSWCQEIYKESKLQICPPLSTAKEVGYDVITTKGVRTNTYPGDSVHHRYRLIHYNCFIHTSPQPHTVHPKGIGLFTTICLIHQNHNCTVHQHWLLPCLWLYQYIILVLHQKSMSVNVHSSLSLRMGSVVWFASQLWGDLSSRS